MSTDGKQMSLPAIWTEAVPSWLRATPWNPLSRSSRSPSSVGRPSSSSPSCCSSPDAASSSCWGRPSQLKATVPARHVYVVTRLRWAELVDGVTLNVSICHHQIPRLFFGQLSRAALGRAAHRFYINTDTNHWHFCSVLILGGGLGGPIEVQKHQAALESRSFSSFFRKKKSAAFTARRRHPARGTPARTARAFPLLQKISRSALLLRLGQSASLVLRLVFKARGREASHRSPLFFLSAWFLSVKALNSSRATFLEPIYELESHQGI